jgi:hypothetical protein
MGTQRNLTITTIDRRSVSIAKGFHGKLLKIVLAALNFAVFVKLENPVHDFSELKVLDPGLVFLFF